MLAPTPLSDKKELNCHFFLLKGGANYKPMTPVHKERIVALEPIFL
jgi:hypothetical protein